jgi:hypothetical protein
VEPYLVASAIDCVLAQRLEDGLAKMRVGETTLAEIARVSA